MVRGVSKNKVIQYITKLTEEIKNWTHEEEQRETARETGRAIPETTPSEAQEKEDSEEVPNKDFKTMFKKLIKKLNKSMNANLDFLGVKISNLSKKLSELDKSFEDQDLRIVNLEQMKSGKVGSQDKTKYRIGEL